MLAILEKPISTLFIVVLIASICPLLRSIGILLLTLATEKQKRDLTILLLLLLRWRSGLGRWGQDEAFADQSEARLGQLGLE